MPARERVMLEFVETLTLAPWEVSARDHARLRDHGLRDSEIAQIALGCAHFNYLNRMADGLGIQFEYPTRLEPFVAGAGAKRRHEVARTKMDKEYDAETGRNEASPNTHQDGPRSDFLEIVRSIHGGAAAGITEWRAHHLRGTERLSGGLRALIANRAAALEHGPAPIDPPPAAGLTEDLTEVLAEENTPRTTRILEHARRLLQEPASCRREHVDLLRADGLDDRDVLQLTMLVGYLAFERRARAGLAILAPRIS